MMEPRAERAGGDPSQARVDARAKRRRVCVVLAMTMFALACVNYVVHDTKEGGLMGNGAARSAMAVGMDGRATTLAGSILAEGEEGEGGKRDPKTAAEQNEAAEKAEHEKLIEEGKIKARWGFAFVTIIIIFSVAFVKATDYIKEAVPKDLEEVVLALMEELTTLGFLGFAFFMFTVRFGESPSLIEQASIYALNEPEALKELFEGLHYLVFFVSLSFILCTVSGLWSFQFGPSGSLAWAKYEEHGYDVYNRDKPELLHIERQNLNPGGRLLTEWSQDDHTTRAEYLRIRSRFIETCEEPRLDGDFDFHKYLQRRVGETFSSMIEIEWRDWAVTWLVLLFFWSVVQEGLFQEKLLFLYCFFMLMSMSLCIILQAKIVWVKAQLVPRHFSEMRPSYADSHQGSKLQLARPVFEDQRVVTVHKEYSNKAMEIFHHYRKAVMKLLHIRKRPGNKHERLFWFDAWGPGVMKHMIRLSMLWIIISLALLLSHHLPGIVSLGSAICWGQRWVGYIFFGVIAGWHIVAMGLVYVTARVYTVSTSIEMMKDKELIELIVREQKYEKCTEAIEMLFTLNYYMEHMQMLKEHSKGDKMLSPRAKFQPETPEEQKALEDLEELFRAFDSDGSGELDQNEVKDMMKAMGTNLDDDEIQKLIQVMDADGSGTISLDEIAGVMLNKKKLNREQIKLSQVGKQLFDMFDTDGSGSIRVEEMIDTFSKMGKNWNMEQVKTFFDLIDRDGSGDVDRQEFLDFIGELESFHNSR